MDKKKKILITVGPQGSGNHLFGRVFSMHPAVTGWEELKDFYWVKHGREPFVEYFLYPEILTEDVFSSGDYFTTNVSFPVNFDGIQYTPKIMEFVSKVRSWSIDVVIAVITRDETITRFQQQRLRNKHTIDSAIDYVSDVLLPSDIPTHFISTETFFTYKTTYLKYLEKLLDFPIGYNEPDILKFIEESPNAKYITPVDSHWLDAQNGEGGEVQPVKSFKDTQQ
jgi:hypothetical protein